MADNDNERRRAERIPVNAEFGRMELSAFVSDLSERGVFVHSDSTLPVGQLVELRFTVLLDDPVLIVTKGRVIRHSDEPKGMGVEFVQMEPDTLLRIHDALARRRPQGSGPPVSPSPADSAATAPFLDVDLDIEASGRRPVHRVGQDEFEEGQTLVALRPVDLEIVDDEAGEGDGGGDGR
jgi:hypothetical protein